MILIVDDDAAVRYTLREILEADGHTVVEATDGEDALSKAHSAALIISDLRMLKMDGMQLVQRLKDKRIVLITAHGSERQAVEAMKAGAWDYFRKPFDTDELKAVVRRALETTALQAENDRLKGELALQVTLHDKLSKYGE